MRPDARAAALLLALLVAPVARATPADDLARERQELNALLDGDVKAQLAGLPKLVRDARDPEVRRFAHRGLGQTYAKYVLGGGKPVAELEGLLVDAAVPADALVGVCYGFATEKAMFAVAERCLARLPPEPDDPQLAAERNRLAGTLAFASGDLALAYKSLSAAAAVLPVDADPPMHLRLAKAQLAVGKAPASCSTAKALYRAHPLLGGARDALAACGDGTATATAVQEEARATLLASERKTGKPMPSLSLDDDKGLPVDLELSKSGKLTVLVFFSSWCPHCGLELPRVQKFADTVAKDPKLARAVDLVGIRTAVEREREPWAGFQKRLGLRFRILTDSTLSLVFVQAVRAMGREPKPPTIAVADRAGVVRYVLEAGDYKDTATELGWALEALLSAPPAPGSGKEQAVPAAAKP